MLFLEVPDLEFFARLANRIRPTSAHRSRGAPHTSHCATRVADVTFHNCHEPSSPRCIHGAPDAAIYE
jgi:hypothetical protein